MNESNSNKSQVMVTVIMPSFNQSVFLERAVNSVLSQSFRDLELIVIDDCSTDNSKSIVENFCKLDRRVKLISHEKNMGRSQSRNDGIAKANGSYIAFIDSDDEWKPDKLERQLSFCRLEKVVVWTEAEIIDKDSHHNGMLFSDMIRSKKFKCDGYIFDELLGRNYICHSSLLIPREFLKNVKFDGLVQYLQDYDLNVALASQYYFKYLKEPLTRYRLHGDNSIYKDKEGWARDHLLVRSKFIRLYGYKLTRSQKSFLYIQISWSAILLRNYILVLSCFLRAELTDLFAIFRAFPKIIKLYL